VYATGKRSPCDAGYCGGYVAVGRVGRCRGVCAAGRRAPGSRGPISCACDVIPARRPGTRRPGLLGTTWVPPVTVGSLHANGKVELAPARSLHTRWGLALRTYTSFRGLRELACGSSLARGQRLRSSVRGIPTQQRGALSCGHSGYQDRHSLVTSSCYRVRNRQESHGGVGWLGGWTARGIGGHELWRPSAGAPAGRAPAGRSAGGGKARGQRVGLCPGSRNLVWHLRFLHPRHPVGRSRSRSGYSRLLTECISGLRLIELSDRCVGGRERRPLCRFQGSAGPAHSWLRRSHRAGTAITRLLHAAEVKRRPRGVGGDSGSRS